MTLDEIKSTPRHELDGLLYAYNLYTSIHAYDGYDEKDIANMSKDKPQIRESYTQSNKLKRKYEVLTGLSKPEKQVKTLSELLT